jgi:hypothetical protein
MMDVLMLALVFGCLRPRSATPMPTNGFRRVFAMLFDYSLAPSVSLSLLVYLTAVAAGAVLTRFGSEHLLRASPMALIGCSRSFSFASSSAGW